MLQCELRSNPCAAGREGRWVSPPHRLHVKVSEAMLSTVTPSLSDGISPTGRRIDDRSLRCNPLSHNKEWFFLSSQWTWQTYWAVTGRASSLPQSLHTLSFNFWKRVWRTWIKARIRLKHLHELGISGSVYQSGAALCILVVVAYYFEQPRDFISVFFDHVAPI